MHFHFDGGEKISLLELGREVDGPSSQLPPFFVVTISSGVTKVTGSSSVTMVTSSSGRSGETIVTSNTNSGETIVN